MTIQPSPLMMPPLGTHKFRQKITIQHSILLLPRVRRAPRHFYRTQKICQKKTKITRQHFQSVIAKSESPQMLKSANFSRKSSQEIASKVEKSESAQLLDPGRNLQDLVSAHEQVSQTWNKRLKVNWNKNGLRTVS